MGTSDPFRLRIASDLHVGSRWGLWPSGSWESEGERYAQNYRQEWLWECWLSMCEDYPVADLLIVNGDTREGAAPKDRGAGVKATETDIQQEATVAVLEPAVARARAWMMTRGTVYHERALYGIAKALKATPGPEAKVQQILDLDIWGVMVNVAHHPEGGQAIYKGTILDRMILWSIIASKLGKAEDSEIIIRSHWHHYDMLQSNGRTAIQTPGWEFQTPYMARLAFYRYQPDIGFVDVLIRPGEYPVVIPQLWPLPKRKIKHFAIGGGDKDHAHPA